MISGKTKERILDGLLKSIGCSKDDLLNFVSQFFDIYEGIDKRIMEDHDYKFAITHYSDLIKTESEPLTLYGWKLGAVFERFYHSIPLTDPKNRNFIDVFKIFDPWVDTCSFEKLKGVATKTEMEKMNKLAKNIKRVIEKRNKVKKRVDSILNHDYLMCLEDLKKYAPTLYKAYEEG